MPEKCALHLQFSCILLAGFVDATLDTYMQQPSRWRANGNHDCLLMCGMQHLIANAQDISIRHARMEASECRFCLQPLQAAQLTIAN